MGCGASSYDHGVALDSDRRQASEPQKKGNQSTASLAPGSQPSVTASSCGTRASVSNRGQSAADGRRGSQEEGSSRIPRLEKESVTRDEDPLAAVSKGVTLRGLRRLRQLIQSHFGEERYGTLTTSDVVSEWVQVVTASHKCRVAEMLSLVRQKDVGVPYYFISHAWKNPFEGLVAAVEERLAAAGEETVVWIDIFAVNQHEDTHYQARDLAAFKDVVRVAAGGTLVVMGSDLAASNPAMRAWCIYEWAATLSAHGSDGLLMALSSADRGRLVRELDVERAECFKPEDKAYILGDVVAQHGSTAAFNTKLKLQLTLEPLHYSVDLHRLRKHHTAQSSEATDHTGGSATGKGSGLWAWGPVEAWALGGPVASPAVAISGTSVALPAEAARGSAASAGAASCGAQRQLSRVMCITGGPGEGKSSIAAELLSEEGPLCSVLRGSGSRSGSVVSGSGAIHAGNGGDSCADGCAGNSSVASVDGGDGNSNSCSGRSGSAAAAPGDAGGRSQGGSVVLAYHFFKYDDQRRQEPVRIIKSLAFQLALKLPAVRDAVLQLDPAAVALLGEQDVEPAFEALLMRPLVAHAAQPNARRVIIVLDGLDEADPQEEPGQDHGQQPHAHSLPHPQVQAVAQSVAPVGTGATKPSVAAPGCSPLPVIAPRVRGNAALTLLTGQLCRLPVDVVRFVVTMRPEAAAGQALPSLLRTFGAAIAAGGSPAAAPAIALPTPVVHFTTAQLRKSGGGSAGEAGSGGQGEHGGHVSCVLLCRAVAEACASMDAAAAATSVFDRKKCSCSTVATVGPSAAATLGGDASLEDLYGLYGNIFATSFASYGGDEAKLRTASTLLAVLLAAREPLSEAFLEKLGLGRAALALLPGGGRLFFVHEHRVHLMHRTLAEFLQRPAADRVFVPNPPPSSPPADSRAVMSWPAVDLAGGHWVIARHLFDKELAAPSPYCLRYIVHHLTAALSYGATAAGSSSAGISANAVDSCGRPAELLERVVSDFAFLARICASGNGPRIISALGSLPVSLHTKISYDALRWLRASLYDGNRGVGGSAAGRVESQLGTAVALARTVLYTVPVTSPLQRVAAEVRKQAWYTARVLPWRAPYRSWSPLGLTLRGHSAEACAVAWSPEGRQLISGGADGLICVWDPSTAECIAVLAGHAGPVRCLRWNPYGRQIASSSRDQTVRIWDVVTGQVVAVLLAGDAYGMAWGPGGRLLATAGTGATGVFLWDSVAGTCVALLQGHSSWVWSVAWSPDGGILASGGADGMVRLWNVATGQQLTAPLGGHSADVNSVAWSPDGRRLLSGGSDGTVRQWDAVTGKQLGSVMRGHTDAVVAVEWGPGLAAATGGSGAGGSSRAGSGTAAGAGRSRLGGGSGNNSTGGGGSGGMGAAADIHVVSGACDRTVRLWNALDGSCVAVLESDPAARVTAVAWRPDGIQIAASAADGTVRVWDVAAAKAEPVAAGLHPKADHSGKAAAVPTAVCGGAIPSAGSCPQTPTPTPAQTPSPVSSPSTGPRVGVSWSPDGKLLAGGCDGSAVGVWDADAGECIAVLYGHAFDVSCVCWSPDGKRLASSGGDETVRIWDLVTRTCVLTVRESSPLSSRPAASLGPGPAAGASGQDPDQGKESGAAAPVDQALHPHLWDDQLAAAPPLAAALPPAPEGLAEVLDLTATSPPPPLGGGHVGGMASPPSPESASWGWVFAVAWSPDGERLAAASADGAVRLLCASSGSCISLLRGHVGAALRVVWSPNSRRLASCGSDDGSVRIWDTSTHGGGAAGAAVGGAGGVSCVRVLQLKPCASSNGAAGGSGGGIAPFGVVSQVAWSPDSRQLACTDAGGAVRIWDVEGGTCTAILLDHVGAVYGVAWCPKPGAYMLASGGDDGTVRIWETDANPCGAASSAGILAQLVSGASRNVWRCVEVLEGHTRAVEGVTWNPSGRRLASASADRTVRIWYLGRPGSTGAA